MKKVWAICGVNEFILFESHEDAKKVHNCLPTGWHVREYPVIQASTDINTFDISNPVRPEEDSGFALLGPM